MKRDGRWSGTAETAEQDIGSTETDEDIFQQAHHNRAPKITVGDFRAAKSALAAINAIGETGP